MAVLQYSSTKKGDITVIQIGGSLDAETAPKFAEKLQGEISKGSKKLLCDIHQLNYIASAGLGVFISMNALIRKKGGELRLSSMNAKTRKIFTLLGFINLFVVYGTMKEALEKF